MTSIPDTFNLHGSIWASQDGDQHIEFDDPGASIEQVLDGLSVGRKYVIIFGLTGNPDRDRIYGLKLDINDSKSTIASENFEVSSIGTTRETIVWTDKELDFIATEPSMTFRFTRTDLTPAGAGPDLDNVRIVFSCPADLNNDATLNFFDISAFLTAFSAGCP